MSLLLGTIKNKFGLQRRFQDISLTELNFTPEEEDYFLNDLDEDDDVISPVDIAVLHNPNKHLRWEDTILGGDTTKKGRVDVDVKPELIQSFADCTISPKLEVQEPPCGSSWSSATLREVELKPVFLSPVKEEPTPDLVENDSLPDSEEESERISVETVDEILHTLETICVEQRSLIVRSDGFISTPLHALKLLSVQCHENVYVGTARYGKEHFCRNLTRVELCTGVFSGVGEAFNHRMAAQLAALDILLRVDKADTEGHIVPFGWVPGWRIRAKVCEDMMLVCQKNGLKWPRYITKSNADVDLDLPTFSVECYIGEQLISRGDSDLASAARKLAAAKAIEAVTGESYPVNYAAFGSACMTKEELATAGYFLTEMDNKKLLMSGETSKDDVNACKKESGQDTKETNLKIIIGTGMERTVQLCTSDN